MNEIKKDHSIGEGTGAVAGAIAGAAVGAVGGPAGVVIGAIAGGALGAKGGGAVAEAINPTVYNSHFEQNYQNSPSYVSGKGWGDYQPAYKYGYDTYGEYRGQKFDDVQDTLERNWDATKGQSRLAWGEAKGAVRDGWHHIERAMPGDANGDGR